MEEVTVTVDIMVRKRRRSAAFIIWKRIEGRKKQERKKWPQNTGCVQVAASAAT